MIPEITPCLTLSISHLQPEDRDMLDCDAPCPVSHTGKYGAVCYVVEDLALPHAEFNYDEGGWSPAFHECLRFALRHGCGLVRFDHDGPEFPGLPTFTGH